MVERFSVPMQLWEKRAKLHTKQSFKVNGMVLDFAHLELGHKAQNFKIQNSSLKEHSCLFQSPEHLVAQCYIVKDDHDDESVLLEVLKPHLLDEDLGLLKKDQSSVPFFSVHVQ